MVEAEIKQNKLISRRTSLSLIEKAVSEGWIKQLAFYHIIKFRVNNSCIYNYRNRMDVIANQLNISTKTLYNYLKVLRSKNLVFDHANNLKLRSIRQYIVNHNKCFIALNNTHSLFDVTCLLYGKLIEHKAQQQAYAESARRFGRGDRYKSEPCENPFLPSLSYRTIAKLLNVSECKAYKVVTYLDSLGIIRIIKQKPRLLSKNFTELQSITDYPGYRFNIGNNLFEQFGNRIDFLQFPVSLKRITIRQYKKYISSDL